MDLVKVSTNYNDNTTLSSELWREREGGRERGRKGGREREREGGREGGRKGGREGGREREREEGREGESLSNSISMYYQTHKTKQTKSQSHLFTL